MITNNNAIALIESPVRKIVMSIALIHFDGLGQSFTSVYEADNNLKSITIDRIGDNTKFYGFGICQKLNFHLLDTNRQLAIKAGDIAKVYVNNETSVGSAEPIEFKVTEVHRDENTNELSVTAYDPIYFSANKYSNDINYVFTQESTIRTYAEKACEVIGQGTIGTNLAAFDIACLANFGGTETIREMLDDIAEATQTIYFCTGGNKIVFKRLDKDGAAVYTINKPMYFSLDSKTSRRLNKVVRATSLGDNVGVEKDYTGTAQSILDNAFWDVFEGAELETILNDALEVVGGLTINQFNCSWRGNWLLEPCDKIGIETKDNSIVYSYLLNDTITYNGSYNQISSWEYGNTDTEDFSNPASLGDALKVTFAKVDKLNNEISIIAANTQGLPDEVAAIKLTTNSISAAVEEVRNSTGEAVESIHEEMITLTNRVESTVTSETLDIKIQEAMRNGTTAVTTTTGFTFNEAGLAVSKSNSEMSTLITEDGMIVSRGEKPMLVANNEGVNAVNLHASTYLNIGVNSRFEDYENKSRTGCFWIGG